MHEQLFPIVTLKFKKINILWNDSYPNVYVCEGLSHPPPLNMYTFIVYSQMNVVKDNRATQLSM